MKRLTSFTELTTGEGIRVAYTYSEIDNDGNLVSQNNKGNFIVVDDAIKEHIEAITKYVTEKYLSGKEV